MKPELRLFKFIDKTEKLLRDYIRPIIFFLGSIVLLALLLGIVVLLFSSLLPEFNSLSLLPAISISAGILIAIVTFIRERELNSSKIFLERTIVGFDDVINLLKDQNNDRIIWIHAARTLLQAQDLGAKINSPEYKKAYTLEVDRVRGKLYKILSFDDTEIGHRSTLPPHFFFGGDDWQDDYQNKVPLGELAIKASEEMKAYSIDINKLPPQHKPGPMSEKSIVAIFNFLKFPEDFSDLLQSTELWTTDWGSTLGVFGEQGARQYLAHKNRYYVVGKELYDRENEKK